MSEAHLGGQLDFTVRNDDDDDDDPKQFVIPGPTGENDDEAVSASTQRTQGRGERFGGSL